MERGEFLDYTTQVGSLWTRQMNALTFRDKWRHPVAF